MATGLLSLVSHLTGFTGHHPIEPDIVWALLVNLAALVAGGFMLRAANWARWLALAWIGFHVILSLFHSAWELGIHTLVFAGFAYFLFRRQANDYFRGFASR
jgi:hypothetical protein